MLWRMLTAVLRGDCAMATFRKADAWDMYLVSIARLDLQIAVFDRQTVGWMWGRRTRLRLQRLYGTRR